MRLEYDFDYSTAIRGKYYRRLLKEGANVVVLEPDVAKAFRSPAAVAIPGGGAFTGVSVPRSWVECKRTPNADGTYPALPTGLCPYMW